MRVIAGEAKGTRLAPVPGGTRPLSDRAREGLFSSLGEAVRGARCADLFAGTGAVGIEALSRGASRCHFVDSAAAAVRTIRENLARTRLEGRASVTRSSVLRFLRRPGESFDLAFLDPPYALGAAEVSATLGALEARLPPGGTAVLTRRRGSSTDVIPVNWQVTRRLSYGDTLILTLERP